MNTLMRFLYRLPALIACLAASPTLAFQAPEDILTTRAILKRVAREINLTMDQDGSSALSFIFHNKELFNLISAYTSLKINPKLIPSYTTARGIVSTQNLCYLLAPAQIAWALQGSLYKKGKLPHSIGHGGSDVCTLFTTTLRQHEQQEKIKASPEQLAFPVRDWLQKHAPSVYELNPDLKPDSKGLAHKVLELYLKHLNAQCLDSNVLEPCPTIRLLDGTSNHHSPIIEFAPTFIEGSVEDEPMYDCAEGITKALAALFPLYPAAVRMVAKTYRAATKLTALPVHVTVQTSLGNVRYRMRGALLYEHTKPHSMALIRQDVQPYWVICDDDVVTPLRQEWTELADKEDTAFVEDALPTDIIYEKQ